MSNFTGVAINPATGQPEQAIFMDNYFGPHLYGVQFADGGVYRESAVESPAEPAKVAAGCCDSATGGARMEWQPIETAPKDGTEVLVAFVYDDGSAEMAVAEWWGSVWAATVKEPGHWRPSTLLPVVFTPTHWMPLPSPSPPRGITRRARMTGER